MIFKRKISLCVHCEHVTIAVETVPRIPLLCEWRTVTSVSTEQARPWGREACLLKTLLFVGVFCSLGGLGFGVVFANLPRDPSESSGSTLHQGAWWLSKGATVSEGWCASQVSRHCTQESKCDRPQE